MFIIIYSFHHIYCDSNFIGGAGSLDYQRSRYCAGVLSMAIKIKKTLKAALGLRLACLSVRPICPERALNRWTKR